MTNRGKVYIPADSIKGRQIASMNSYTPNNQRKNTPEQEEWNKKIEAKKQAKIDDKVIKNG